MTNFYKIMDINQQTAQIIGHSFDLSIPEQVSPEKIIMLLTYRINELLERNPDHLFSLLCRLDISERKIKHALESDHEPTKKIATLVYERQLEKIISRKINKSDKPT